MPRNRSSTEPRSQAPSIIDTDSFVKCYKHALKDDSVKESLRNIIRDEINVLLKPLRDQIKEQKKIIDALEKRTRILEKNADDQEQYSRRESVRLSGIKDEKEENLEDKVLSLFNDKMKTSPPLSPADIARVHRVGTPDPGKPRQIIVKLASYRVRARVFSNKKNLAGTNISLNEDLTKQRATILFRARQAKRQNKIKEAWTHDGRIIVRDINGKLHYNVDLAQLEELETGRRKREVSRRSVTDDDDDEGDE